MVRTVLAFVVALLAGLAMVYLVAEVFGRDAPAHVDPIELGQEPPTEPPTEPPSEPPTEPPSDPSSERPSDSPSESPTDG